MLNAKQEKFILNIINGMSQREAYKDAYDAKYKDEAIDVKACELFNLDKVQVRYKELRDKVIEKDIMSAKERMKFLSDIASGKEKDTVYYNVHGENTPIEKSADLSTRIKAVDTLNKMTGEYIEKLKLSSEEDKPFEVNITVIK